MTKPAKRQKMMESIVHKHTTTTNVVDLHGGTEDDQYLIKPEADLPQVTRVTDEGGTDTLVTSSGGVSALRGAPPNVSSCRHGYDLHLNFPAETHDHGGRSVIITDFFKSAAHRVEYLITAAGRFAIVATAAGVSLTPTYKLDRAPDDGYKSLPVPPPSSEVSLYQLILPGLAFIFLVGFLFCGLKSCAMTWGASRHDEDDNGARFKC